MFLLLKFSWHFFDICHSNLEFILTTIPQPQTFPISLEYLYFSNILTCSSSNISKRMNNWLNECFPFTLIPIPIHFRSMTLSDFWNPIAFKIYFNFQSQNSQIFSNEYFSQIFDFFFLLAIQMNLKPQSQLVWAGSKSFKTFSVFILLKIIFVYFIC